LSSTVLLWLLAEKIRSKQKKKGGRIILEAEVNRNAHYLPIPHVEESFPGVPSEKPKTQKREVEKPKSENLSL